MAVLPSAFSEHARAENGHAREVMSSLGTRDPRVGERSGAGGESDGSGRRRWPRRLLLGIGAAVAVCALVAGGLYGYGRYRFDQIKTVHVPSLGDSAGAAAGSENILLVGSDSRAVQGNDTQAFGSAQQVLGQRADVIKIIHLVPDKSQATELTIPRDLLVTLAGSDHKGRINTAFENGPDQLVRTIEQQFDIPIDHYVLITFESFKKVVNALGGIHLDFPTPARDKFTGLNITHAGCQHLDGAQALAVARSRHYSYFRNGSWHYDPTGDFGRIDRQSVFLQAVIHEAHSIGLLHPLKANAFLTSIAGAITIDDAWSFNHVISLGTHYRHFDSSQLKTYVLPTSIANNYGNLGDVLLPEKSADHQVIAQFLHPATVRSAAPAPRPSASKPAAASTPVQQVPLSEPADGSFNPRVCSG
jgi:LCP family protein required for cell wall assembly